ncbi:hypothetical protein KOR42_37670 [Thalassoglobus neptunius]|uniref:Uncharacterized protein n=1 Tax=Thalassoglobus neptunius TaxID=1938619 RepID=A0A5C5WII9_9PLAN|nr:hypothetical protein [Thalassoglobus neptunius]TWT49949.1 hypothetical protein KOR42_37670 [Thalassoglobus neptunius]
MNTHSHKVRRSIQSHRRGAALVIAIIALILCSSFSLSMIRTTVLRQQRFIQRRDMLQAQLIAEAAVDRIKVEKLDQEVLSHDKWDIEVLGEKGLVTSTVTQNDGKIEAKVTARYPVSVGPSRGISSSIVVPLGPVESQHQSESQTKESM